MKIIYILSHPIQYQTPLIRYLVKKKIDITVAYKSLHTTGKFYDKNFKKKILWDQNLIKNYNYFKINKYNFSFLLNPKTRFVWVHGTKNFYNFLVIILASIIGKKVLIREESNKYSKNRNEINLFLNKIYYKFIDLFIDYYLAIGKLNKEYYLSKNIKRSKIVKVPYVVNNEFFFNKINKIKKNINFLFVGKINSLKGIDVLYEAITKIPPKTKVFFDIIGSGELLKIYKKKIKIKKINFVKFHGFINQKKLKKFYKKSDILIVPSKIEPWGLVVNEAMCSGNAIIASNMVGCAADLIIKNKNGYLFKSKNSDDLYAKMLYYINNKKKLQDHKKYSQKIISKYDFESCFKSLKKITN